MTAEQPTLLRRLAMVVSLVCLFLSFASPIIIWRWMEDMRSNLQQTILATGDLQRIASFETALQMERRSAIGILVLILLSAALFIGWGLLVATKVGQKPNKNAN
jgi:hypothetical protein